MLILGIESSCDDTSVALLDCSKRGFFVLNEKTASQIDIHKKYGGVVPEIAGRMHAEKIVPLVEEVLRTANTSPPPSRGEFKPDVIAVTAGPGLITGLLVGVETARTLSYVWNVPLVAVNHIEGHIYSVEIPNDKLPTPYPSPKRGGDILLDFLSPVRGGKKGGVNKIQYPALTLIASGGHTELIYIPKQGKYRRNGATKDDAAGECFDKVAKLLGLPYPGGPEISKLAESGNPEAIKFPRPMIDSDNYDFSFAGLKTAALYWLRDNTLQLTANTPLPPSRGEYDKFHPVKKTKNKIKQGITINDFCASFEQAIIDVLVAKTIRAAVQYKPKTIILAGGVSANQKLRNTLEKEIKINLPKSEVLSPKSAYCMDNAAMIAVAGYYHALKKYFTDWKKIKADPNWKI